MPLLLALASLVLVLLICMAAQHFALGTPYPEASENNEVVHGVNRRLASMIAHIRARSDVAADPRVVRLLLRFGDKRILPMRAGGSGAAYTLNKGQEIRLCTRGDVDTATFVALHELAHVVTTTQGHDQQFWVNFAFILRLAVDAGVYTPQPFTRERPGHYCGKDITYQPLSNGGQRAVEDFRRGRRRWD